MIDMEQRKNKRDDAAAAAYAKKIVADVPVDHPAYELTLNYHYYDYLRQHGHRDEAVLNELGQIAEMLSELSYNAPELRAD